MLINIGGKLLEIGPGAERIMAIINVTPDSFFSGSRRESEQDIGRGVEKALAEGADMIDLGGYSSRPGALVVSPQEEFGRLERGLRIVREVAGAEFPVSVDTFRASVVKKIYHSFGAFIVNDISAGNLDTEMIPLAGKLGLPYIAMHMRGTPQTMTSLTDYSSGGRVVISVLEYFAKKITEIREGGVKDLILDPGFGFAKTTTQNIELLKDMNRLLVFELPVLVGLSRKSLIWRTLGITPEEALNGTSVVNYEALKQGASILRVHDVREAVQTLRLFRELEQA